MELPRALGPWRQSLSIFPKDLAIALGGIIDKLSLLIGPLVSPDAAGRNEPDGFDGLGRRGSFERLLTSEWALADEAPLEFLRRASTGELSFLELAHQKPTVARHCVALFDVGPDQRGGPRIVHLALLILLAQRAHDGGAQFSWGILQGARGELLSDVNEESVRTLLQPGNHRRIVFEDVIPFYQAFQDDDPEVWFIGGSSTSETIGNIDANHVKIEDSLDPDAPSDLHVTVVGTHGKPRSVKLELPSVNASVRLLRDPFHVARAVQQKSPVRAAIDTNFVFSRDFRKLFLRGAEGELITIPVPNSPNCKTPPNPRVFRPPPGEDIIAVGRLLNTRTIAVATIGPEGMNIHELSPRLCTSVRQKRYSWRDPGESARILHSQLDVVEARNPAHLGTLFHLGTKGSLFIHVTSDVVCKVDEEAYCLWQFPALHPVQQGGILSWMRGGVAPEWVYHHAEPDNVLKLPSGTQEIRNALGGFLAARTSPTTWQVLDAKGNVVYTREIPLEYEVLGVCCVKNEIWFYVLDTARTRMFCFNGEKKELCFTLSSPVRTIHATPASWCIAFLTEEDELCIYSRDYKTFLLRMRLGGK